jgi:hypothetical protein
MGGKIQITRGQELVCLGILTVFLAWLTGGISSPAKTPVVFALAYLLSFIPWFITVSFLRRGKWEELGRWSPVWVLGVSVMCLFMYMRSEPGDDLYRYAWEGKIQMYGFNPYSIRPDSAELDFIRDENGRNLNHPEWTAIYGPVAQSYFAVVAAISPTRKAFQAGSVFAAFLANIALLWLLRAVGKNPLWCVVFSWNPLVFWAFGAEGHLDSWMVAALVAAFAARMNGRDNFAALGFAVAAGFKATALLFFPCFLLRSPRKTGFISLAILAFFYLPYASAGFGLIKSLRRFGRDSQFNGAFHALFSMMFNLPTASIIGAIAVLTVVVICILKKTKETQSALWLNTVFILFSPTVHSWYITWQLPCLCCHWRASFGVLCMTMVCTLAPYAHQVQYQEWVVPGWMSFAIYLPFALAFFLEFMLVEP